MFDVNINFKMAAYIDYDGEKITESGGRLTKNALSMI